MRQVLLVLLWVLSIQPDAAKRPVSLKGALSEDDLREALAVSADQPPRGYDLFGVPDGKVDLRPSSAACTLPSSGLQCGLTNKVWWAIPSTQAMFRQHSLSQFCCLP